jgi:hypothetical protein
VFSVTECPGDLPGILYDVFSEEKVCPKCGGSVIWVDDPGLLGSDRQYRLDKFFWIRLIFLASFLSLIIYVLVSW